MTRRSSVSPRTATSVSHTTATAVSSRCTDASFSASTVKSSNTNSPRPVRPAVRRPMPTSRPRPSSRCATPTRKSSRFTPASRSRRTPRSSCAAPSKRCFVRGTDRARSHTACARRSATTSALPSTFRRWCSATVTRTQEPASASRATPQPARTSPTATFSSTPRAKTSLQVFATLNRSMH